MKNTFIKSFGILAAYSLFWLLNLGTFPYYWYQVQASPNGFADVMVAKYFKLTIDSSHWWRPVFRKLVYNKIYNKCCLILKIRILDLTIPVALIYGEFDDLMAPHQVRLIIMKI